jgi:hypothetical protein
MKAGRAIWVGGAAAGTLDLTWALVVSAMQGRAPLRVLHSISSGLLGKAAYDGGVATAVLGVILHFVIAFGACAVYYTASRRLPFLVRRPAVAGPLYGIGVYLFMYRVVVPLSAAPWKFSFTPKGVALALAAHTLCVGLPIALAVRRYSPPLSRAPRNRPTPRAVSDAG